MVLQNAVGTPRARRPTHGAQYAIKLLLKDNETGPGQQDQLFHVHDKKYVDFGDHNQKVTFRVHPSKKVVRVQASYYRFARSQMELRGFLQLYSTLSTRYTSCSPQQEGQCSVDSPLSRCPATKSQAPIRYCLPPPPKLLVATLKEVTEVMADRRYHPFLFPWPSAALSSRQQWPSPPSRSGEGMTRPVQLSHLQSFARSTP